MKSATGTLLLCVLLMVFGLFEAVCSIVIAAVFLGLIALVLTSPIWITYYIIKFLSSL